MKKSFLIVLIVLAVLLSVAYRFVPLWAYQDWNPKTNPVWDPDHSLNSAVTAELKRFLSKAPIKTYVAVFSKLDKWSVGPQIAKFISQGKNYNPTGGIAYWFAQKNTIGEKATEPSIVLVVTRLRRNPSRQFAISANIPVDQSTMNAAYHQFAIAITAQHTHGLANPCNLVQGTKAALSLIYDQNKK